MMSKRSHALVPLRHFAGEGGHDLRCLDRIRDAWPIIAGPGNSSISHPVSFRHGQLLIGCHDTSVLLAMRDAAQGAGPELCRRIQEMLGIRVQRVEVTASDPAPALLPAAGKSSPPEDAGTPSPLEAVLAYYAKAGGKAASAEM
jgi:hypothetical protein